LRRPLAGRRIVGSYRGVGGDGALVGRFLGRTDIMRRYAVVPRLIGFNATDAVRALRHFQLQGCVESTHTLQEKPFITSQQPQAGTRVRVRIRHPWPVVRMRVGG